MAVMGKKKRIVTLVTVHAILILLVFTALFPIALVVLNSFKPHVAIVANPLSWPESFIPVNYSRAWSYAKFGIGFKNSIILAACTIVIVLFASTLGGYVLATRRGKVVNLALVYFMIVMTIPIQLFLFPLYYVMSYLKLVGTVVPISFILAARNIPLALFLMRTFFLNVPKELEEAARIDGANTGHVLWYVMAPVVSPGLLTVSVIVGLNAWNEFLITSTFLQGEKNFTATLMLRSMSGQFGSDIGIMMAGAMILIAPVLIFFMITQRYFIDGLVSGSVKG